MTTNRDRAVDLVARVRPGEVSVDLDQLTNAIAEAITAGEARGRNATARVMPQLIPVDVADDVVRRIVGDIRSEFEARHLTDTFAIDCRTCGVLVADGAASAHAAWHLNRCEA